MSYECPIHKVAKVVNPLADNECQSCEYFNDCFELMTSDMGEEMMVIAAKHIKEMQDVVKEHITRKIKGESNGTR